MRGEPVYSFTGYPDRGLASVGGRAVYGVAIVLSAAVRVLVVVVLRLIRPFIMFPLLLVMLSGLGAAVVFV